MQIPEDTDQLREWILTFSYMRINQMLICIHFYVKGKYINEQKWIWISAGMQP